MSKHAEPTPGDVIGHWTVLRQVEKPFWCPKGSGTYYEARCSCGTVRVHRGYMLRAGKSKSCGCANTYSPYFGGRKG